MVTRILTTKLHISSLRRNLVLRQRLIERLDQGVHRKLTLVSAPAGFGKTTLLGVWIESLQAGGSPPVQVAWISLDEGDNDPARFSAYLAAALQQADERLGPDGGDATELTASFLQESNLVQLINRVAALPLTCLLILDDYHLITAQPIHNALEFLLEHQPPNLHLVLATRADPPLPLARLRARGQLNELRQSDLRFTAEEAVAFLNNVMALDLSAEDVAALEARTEGWIAGLQMASLAMQARLSLQGQIPDPTRHARSEFIQAFTGSHRFVLDYLVEEVLEQQPPDLQEFLLKTSILERLTGPLCDAVLEIEDRRLEAADSQYPNSQSILDHLDVANLFIVPLDDERHWYRYHRLFSDLLRKRLQQAYPDLVPALHRRASEWHAQQGLTAEAIDHALAARDFEQAATLVEENVEATLMRSEVITFLNWVDRLPDEQVRRRPTLCFFHAWALLMSGQSLDAVERRLQDIACVEESPEATSIMDGRMAALRAYLMLFRADTDRAANLCHQALALLPEHDRFLRSIVAWILSLARLAEVGLQDGSQAFQEVARVSQEIGNPLIAVAALRHQAELHMRQGRLHRAREILEQALQLATDPRGRRLPIASEALIGLGELELEWNNLQAAADHLLEGIELARQWSELAAFDAYFPLMRIRLAQGNVEVAHEAIETARQIATRSETTQIDDLVADLQQAHFLLAQGDLAGAARWAENRGLMPGASAQIRPDLGTDQDLVSTRLRKYEQILLARLFLLQGQAAAALDLLDSLLALARQLGRVDLTTEIQILRALACRAEGQDAPAMAALTEALSLAEPGGAVRVFLDAGEPLRFLLSDFRLWIEEPARQIDPQGQNRLRRYADQLLAAFPGQETPSPPETEHPISNIHYLVEPLSERELEVLRLLASGLSNPEIADELVIAVSTVRSHCKNIYGKLGVHKRWDAVQRGQELGLV